MNLYASFRARVWEVRQPLPGLRHNDRPLLVPHRFPIKGGLTFGEALCFGGRNVLLTDYAESETVRFRGLPIRVTAQHHA